MGALLPMRQTASCIKPQGGLSPPVQQSRSSLRTQWESLHQSHLLAFSASDGAPLSVQQSRWLPSVAWEPSIRWVKPRLEYPCLFSVGRGSPFWWSRASAPFGRSAWAPHLSLESCCILGDGRDSPFRCSRAAAPFGRSESPSFDTCHRAPLLAARRARQSAAAAPAEHCTSSPVALPPFHLQILIYISPQHAYFGGQLTFALWLLSHALSFFWGVLWVRAIFRAWSPPPGQQAKICLLLLSD